MWSISKNCVPGMCPARKFLFASISLMDLGMNLEKKKGFFCKVRKIKTKKKGNEGKGSSRTMMHQ